MVLHNKYCDLYGTEHCGGIKKNMLSTYPPTMLLYKKNRNFFSNDTDNSVRSYCRFLCNKEDYFNCDYFQYRLLTILSIR